MQRGGLCHARLCDCLVLYPFVAFCVRLDASDTVVTIVIIQTQYSMPAYDKYYQHHEHRANPVVNYSFHVPYSYPVRFSYKQE